MGDQLVTLDRSSAGKSKGSSTGKGNPWLAATLGEIIAAAARTDTFLGERYHRIARRRGKRRAIVAVGNSILTIIWTCCPTPDPATMTSATATTRLAPTAGTASAT